MSRRVTAEHVETLALSTVVAKARVTAIHAETLIQRVAVGETRSATDSLNNWGDALAFTYSAPPGPLSRAVVDKFIRKGNINANNLSLIDGLSLKMSPNGPIFVGISDLGAHLDDFVLLNYGQLFTDALSLSDFGQVGFGDFRDLSDTLTLSDSLTTQLVGGFGPGAADSLNSWSDSLAFTLPSSSILSDSLSFADSISLELISSTSFSDSLSLSDVLNLILNHPLNFTDSLVLSDSFTSSEAILQDISVSDDLNFWSDGVGSLGSTTETTYLRQYLNDVIN